MMRRRAFLGTGSAFLSTLPYLASAAPPSPRTHAALVIGISKTEKLPTLRSPVPQAHMLSALLEREGYDVRLHVDEVLSDAERANMVWPIKQSAWDIAAKDSLTQLVIFFSGHGFWSPEKEDVWLLPNALRDPDQAIHVKSLEQLALNSRIRNIVFIGDACRSLPDRSDDAQARVRGSGLFRSPNVPSADVIIDRFFAAKSTKPAYEVEVPADPAASPLITKASDKYESLFTQAILGAFTDPPDTLLSAVDGRQVITNRKLWGYLEDQMPLIAKDRQLYENVAPFIRVPSRDTVYIAGPHSLDSLADATAGMQIQLPSADPGFNAREPSRTQVFVEAFARQNVPFAAPKGPDRTAEFDANLQERLFDLRAQQSRITPMRDPPLSNAPAGIAIYGGKITDIGTTVEFGYVGITDGETVEGTPVTAEIFVADPSDEGASAVLSFDNGTGCVLALLRGYVAHVFVTDQGAGMIAYEPVPGSDAWYEFQDFGQRRGDLRALVTLALKDGLFGVDDSFARAAGDGQTFADQVRFLKFSDPTLGIYAAYGYAQDGIQSEVREIEEIQSGRNQIAPIFDNVLLALNNVPEREEFLENVVPFCPMLRNGWSYLPVKGVAMPEPVQAALRYLTPAVWTSFTEPGVAILLDAVRSGALR
ncbi:Caspase domain-containing protein [Alloyangia pacifica]|uniref:Caspase domain-containing protein n=2 Tax=Alloyangia pacifica TaxID=311180 RepID=A0A1I6WLU3_9RHOB|nr:caspase family protein [Alloyangia pacifica]SDI92053.1 Caspase domain-containing protein [Alloyangia pacifica]SFT26953.1 Caspase domain-containing protein [Alloyangia pacifica]